MTEKGYMVSRELLSKTEEAAIKKELTVAPQSLYAETTEYPIYLYSEKYLYLPKYYGIKKYGLPIKTTIKNGSPITAKIKQEPLPFQHEADLKLAQIFSNDNNDNNNDSGVLSLPCGYGKTYLALRTACRLQLKTIIIVSKEFLRDQWIEAITRFTTGTYGILQQKKLELQYDFCIAMVHTLCLKDFPKGTFSEFGFMIIDECHHLASEMFVKALFKLRPRFILGLSATPERPDGLSHVFHKFIGDVFHKEKRIGVNNVIIKKISITAKDSTDEDIISCYTDKYNKMGLKNTIEMTTCLSACARRNAIIIEIIRILLAQNRTILVLSSRRHHLHVLHSLMIEASLCKKDGTIATCGFYYGKLDTNSREHKEMLAKTATCDVIFGTEHVAKEGLDIPALNTLVFATPPGIYIEQSVGRILRKYHEYYPPLVVDICDKVGNYIEHGRTRDKWFISENYHIDKINININDEINLEDYLKNIIVKPQNAKAQNAAVKFKVCMI